MISQNNKELSKLFYNNSRIFFETGLKILSKKADVQQKNYAATYQISKKFQSTGL